MDIFLQGLTVGLAYLAPIGAQNLFVINTALTAPAKKSLTTAAIVCFFDITLALACFWGVGILLTYYPLLQKIILCGGGLILLYMGLQFLRAKSNFEKSEAYIPSFWKTVSLAFTVTWFNPQAVIDGTLMLGAFRAALSPSEAVYFISGAASASFLWFFGLIAALKTFFSNLQNSHLIWINRFCGIIIIAYAIKLLYLFWNSL